MDCIENLKKGNVLIVTIHNMLRVRMSTHTGRVLNVGKMQQNGRKSPKFPKEKLDIIPVEMIDGENSFSLLIDAVENQQMLCVAKPRSLNEG